jgi:hypothetical protein
MTVDTEIRLIWNINSHNGWNTFRNLGYRKFASHVIWGCQGVNFPSKKIPHIGNDTGSQRNAFSKEARRRGTGGEGLCSWAITVPTPKVWASLTPSLDNGWCWRNTVQKWHLTGTWDDTLKKIDCRIHSLSSPWHALILHPSLSNVHQVRQVCPHAMVKTDCPYVCTWKQSKSLTQLRCICRACSRDRFLPHRHLRYRIGRLHRSPWGALSFFLLVYSPSASRIQLTTCCSGVDAGVLGVWWKSHKSWQLEGAKYISSTECCSTAVMSSTSCSSLLNPSLQGKENVK